ncbi:MAG: sulfite exporter TauE/SafE family protein [Acidobacteria bacterium]|nr:sulfite exporter TauE/SafE family protein [Acidobacteriota bacterium]
MTIKTWLFIVLGIFGAVYLFTWYTAVSGKQWESPGWIRTGIGFVANFFDTLGIGSFATTTSMYKPSNMVRDELIPGTLNVGHTLPTITQAFIYIAIVEVDMTTLIMLIAASVLGMWLAAGVVSPWPRRNIQIGMGIALIVAAGLMLHDDLQQERRRRTGYGAARHQPHHWSHRQFPPRQFDVAGHWSLRPLPDHDQPVGHESEGGIPDYDGFLRFSDAGRKHKVHLKGELRPARSPGAGDRRNPGCAHRGIHRQGDESDIRALAGGRRCALHCDHTAAIGDDREQKWKSLAWSSAAWSFFA